MARDARGAAPARTMSMTAGADAFGHGLPTELKTWLPRAVALAALLAAFAPTIASMIAIWWRSETFAHGFFVAPVAAYMLWTKAHREPVPPLTISWPAVVPLGLCSLAWFGAHLALIAVGEQLAMVAVFVSAIWLLCGDRFIRYAAFPLGFLFLAVPFGEGLIPVLIEHTTNFVVFGLRVIGVPVYREANELVLPTGNWSVVTACSGIRYLLATITVGLVYAFFSIPSGLKRVAFLGTAIAVAVVGNWLRALGIVLLGHYSGNRLAVGADHLIYGWVFFGILIAFLLFLGEALFAAEAQVRGGARPGTSVSDAAHAPASFGASGLVVLVALAILALGHSVKSGPVPSNEFLVPTPDGWRAEPLEAPAFVPAFRSAPAPIAQRFTRAGDSIDLFVYAFAEQRPGQEAFAATNVLVHESDETLKAGAARPGAVESEGTTMPYEDSAVVGAGQDRLIVRTATLGAGGWLGGFASVKRQELIDRLRGRPNSLVRLVFVVRAEEQGGARQARAQLDRFLVTAAAGLESAFAEWTGASAAPAPGS